MNIFIDRASLVFVHDATVQLRLETCCIGQHQLVFLDSDSSNMAKATVVWSAPYMPLPLVAMVREEHLSHPYYNSSGWA